MSVKIQYKTTQERRKKMSDLRQILAKPTATDQLQYPTESEMLDLAVDELYHAVAQRLKEMREQTAETMVAEHQELQAEAQESTEVDNG